MKKVRKRLKVKIEFILSRTTSKAKSKIYFDFNLKMRCLNVSKSMDMTIEQKNR